MSMTRRGFLLAAASAAIVGLETEDAEAKSRKNRRGAGKRRLKTTHAEAASYSPPRHFIMESIKGEVVEGAMQDVRRHPASLTKMLTLYVAFETMKNNPKSFGLDTNIVIPPEAINPQFDARGVVRNHRLQVGKKYPAEDLMIGCGGKSDAAGTTALAVHAGKFYRSYKEKSDLETFIDRMNATAQRLGMTQSHFRNCVGATDDGHYSTAADMAKLVCALQRDFPELSHIAMGRAAGHTSEYLRAHPKETMFSKTGTTTAAGRCLAVCVDINGVAYAGVVIGAGSARERSDIMSRMVAAAKRGERMAVLPENPPIPTRRPERVIDVPPGMLDKQLPANFTASKLSRELLSPVPMGPLKGFAL